MTARTDPVPRGSTPRGSPSPALDPGATPLSIRLPATPTSAARARRWVTNLLRQQGLDPLVEDVRLIVSELVGNAIVHAGSDVELTLAVDTGGVEVGVRDLDGRRLPRLRLVGDDAVGGRGLRLVALLSEAWGVRHAGDAKVVWSRVRRPGARG